MKTTLKTLLQITAVSLSALVASSVMAAPQHDPRGYDRQQPHWNSQKDHKWKDDRSYNQRHVNPSRDWRVGQSLPRQFDSKRFQISDREARRLPNTNRNQQWYKINNDYVLVNERNNKIVRILG